jgi:hypothetical protein
VIRPCIWRSSNSPPCDTLRGQTERIRTGVRFKTQRQATGSLRASCNQDGNQRAAEGDLEPTTGRYGPPLNRSRVYLDSCDKQLVPLNLVRRKPLPGLTVWYRIPAFGREGVARSAEGAGRSPGASPWGYPAPKGVRPAIVAGGVRIL